MLVKKNLQFTSRSVLGSLGFLSRRSCSGCSKKRLRAGSTSVYEVDLAFARERIMLTYCNTDNNHFFGKEDAVNMKSSPR